MSVPRRPFARKILGPRTSTRHSQEGYIVAQGVGRPLPHSCQLLDMVPDFHESGIVDHVT
jgi:hypothetical protein